MTRGAVVFTRKGEEGVVKRLLPLYAPFFDETVIVCPDGQKPDIGQIRAIEGGESSHSGQGAVRRVMNGLTFASMLGHDLYCFLEYDACLLRAPAFFVGVQANRLSESNTDRWKLDHYLHFPWIIDAYNLKVLVSEMQECPFMEGFPDRWMAGQIDRLKIPTRDLIASGDGYSRNTIEPEHEEDFLLALERGVWALHGIKTDAMISHCEKWRTK